MVLTPDEKEHLDNKFNEFKANLWAKFKLPALGLAIVFAGFMSAFAIYMYVSAKADISKAQVEFYQNLISSQKEIAEMREKMIENFNSLIDDTLKQKEKLDSVVKKEEARQKSKNSQPAAEVLELPKDSPKEIFQQRQYKIDPRQYLDKGKF